MKLRRAVGCALTAAVAVLGAGFAPAQATQATANPPIHQAQQAKSVTLVTGDVVRVGAGKPGAEAITMVERPGQKPTPVKVHRANGHTYVYPVALLPDLYAERLDPALFDVTTLVADGYDDASTKTLPLLVTYAGTRTQAATKARASTFAGARRTLVLPSIGAAALAAPKASAKAFWNDIDGDRSVAKIRLDRRVRASLDQSVPQIGAPAAWAKGLTGKGIKVAIVDSGVDATHPGLAGKVVASANFSSSPDVTDRYGHGTHVASIAAGKGTYRGVAPDATLVSAKVLGDDGTGSLSGVVAGIEWAVAQGARVVNLSLGAEDTWDIDPVEEAVDRLTAAKGTLFVVAAGNSPYCSYDDTYVNSPATADSALAVGAVDKADEFASFSCRGPREPDGAIKPELVAPGVDIVAARAAGTSLGEPVNDSYTRASGTSMAAPHVAGSAAILLQQHPTWKASELRARLMSTAKSLPTRENVFTVGAGRVDVARAVSSPIQVSAGKLELGYFRWPYDQLEPTLRELTYTNSSAAPITLSLTAAVDMYGEPVPAGTLTLDKSTLTVPAHGSAKVVVRLDPAKAKPRSYGGVLTAKAGAQTWTTPLGWKLESEVYDLKVKGVNRDGSPMTTDLDIVALDAVDESPVPPFPVMRDGEKILRLPKGEYSVGALALTQESETSPVEATAVVTPNVTLDRDVTVTLDARRAKPVTVAVDGVSGLSTIGGYFGLYRQSGPNGIGGGSYTIGGWIGNDFQRYAVPSAVARTGQLELLTYARLAKPGAVYDVAIPQARSIPSCLAYRVEPSAFARIDTSFGSVGGTGVQVGERWLLSTPLVSQAADFFTVVDAGTRRTTYVLANQVEWAPDVTAATPENAWDRAYYEDAPRRFAPGERLTQRWQHPIATHLISGRDGDIWGGVRLTKSFLWAGFNAFMDERDRVDHHLGRDLHRMTVTRDGEPVGTADERVGNFEMPGGAGTYELRLDSARSYAWWRRSTAISSSWTVRATGEPTAGAFETLPLLLVEYDVPSADLDGDVPSDRFSSIQLAVSHQAGSRVAKVTDVKLELSYDGKNWRSVPVVSRGDGRYTATSFHPRSMAGRTVSVRVDVRDLNGNRLRQTVTDAYGVR